MKQVKEMGIVAVCLLLLGFGICMGVGTFLMYRDGEQEYDTLREYVAVEEPKERKMEKHRRKTRKKRLPWILKPKKNKSRDHCLDTDPGHQD